MRKWIGGAPRRFGWLLLLLLFLESAAFAAQGNARWGATPDFVVDAAIPEPNPERLRQVDNGIYDLLYDTQVRVDGPLETTYRRMAYKVIYRSGLEDGAQIEMNFDPSYESLVLHHVRIIRDGRTLGIGDKVALDILRQEKEIDDGILTGVRTAVLRLPSIRVGDIVDAGWSWVSRPPLWPGEYFGGMQLSWAAPVGLTRYRVDIPSGTGAAVRRHSGAPSPRRVIRDGRVILEWLSKDPEPVAEDAGTPQWHRPWRRVALSTMPRWSEIVQWALPLFAGAGSFPSELEDDMDRIARESGDNRVRAAKALRLVQDRIRYTSLSIGAGSFRPRDPSEVVSQGWGDCKDKSQLLVALLRRLGIEAYPAFTDMDEGAALPKQIPSPTAFDHMIVQIRIGGRSYWVDPTISHQGGDLASLAPLTYRYALPIRPGQQQLEAIPLPPLTEPNVEAIETYRFEPEGMRLDVVTRYSGAAADDARADFATTALAEKETAFLRYYVGSYPGLELRRRLAVEDDRKKNKLVVRESYWLPSDSYADGELFEAFPVNAATLDGVITYPGAGRRIHPLAISYPLNRTHKVVLIASDLSIPAPEEVRVDNDSFSFALDTDRSGDTLTILFSLAGKTPVVPATNFADFSSDADKLTQNLFWTLGVTPGFGGAALASLTLISLIALVALFVAGLFHARAHRNAFPEGESYYPVPLKKFLPLSIASWGVYPFYWFWRNWNWVRQRLGDDILPFWRAFFGVFWLYPLFDRANAKAARAVPIWLGAVGSAMFLIWSVASSIAERIYEDSWIPSVIGILSVLFVVPAVMAVNQNNSVDAVRSNGRFGWLGAAVLVLGPATFILMITA